MPDEEMLLELTNVTKHFRVSGQMLHAVRDVSMAVPVGQTLGLVGESGSGKSTVGRLALWLMEPTQGRIVFQGNDLANMPPAKLRHLRRNMQIIFQDTQASLSPRMSVGAAVEDGLAIQKIGTPKERRMKVDRALEQVGLPLEVADAYPFELSGGQLQRIGIARALVLEPRFIVCDEPVSALDVSIQLQIIKLLMDLQRELGLSYLFISHNLAVVEYLSSSVVVLYLGQVVEQASTEEVFTHPLHPYTNMLMGAIMRVPHPGEQRGVSDVPAGEMPSPFNPPSGCAFHPRCPLAQDVCREKEPELREVKPGHWARCHLA